MKHNTVESLERRLLYAVAPLPVNPTLSATDVARILGQAGSQAKSTQAIVVEDRNGDVLGEYDGSGLVVGPNMTQEEINEIRLDAALRARTASYFESQGEAFTTRTARFIIQDHFPDPIENTPGGPLYGVQFSSAAADDVTPLANNIPLADSPFAVPDVVSGDPTLRNPQTGVLYDDTLLISALGPAGISGDAGGIPLYIMGIDPTSGKVEPMPVGSIGVAGDFSDVAPRKNLVLGSTMYPGTNIREFQYAYAANPDGHFFQGNETADFDESVAEAGSTGFMAPARIQATNVFVGGLRLPFLDSPVAHRNPKLSLDQLVAEGMGTEPFEPVTAPAMDLPTTPSSSAPVTTGGLNPSQSAAVPAVKGAPPSEVSGVQILPTTVNIPDPLVVPGTLVRRDTREDPTQVNQDYGIVASNDTDPTTGAPLHDSDKLTVADVENIITTAVNRAVTTRAGIRNPIGKNVVVYISVVDADGDLLGSFRMGDATNFSYDVSVQKARTAAFFSDNSHAFSSTAIGFMSQRYFSPGINAGEEGPLFELQNSLKTADLNSSGQIVDDTIKPIGEVTAAAAIANPTAGVIPISALGASVLHAGEIITFGDDPTFASRVATNASATTTNDTSNEYVITSVTPAGITVSADNIDNNQPNDPMTQTPIPIAPGDAILPKNPLKDGITIFPGGFPLYKNGMLVGAIGISGDGVNQDDIIGYSGTGATYQADNGQTEEFRPPQRIESDALGADNIANFIGGKLQTIENTFELGSAFTQNTDTASSVQSVEQRLKDGLSDERLPYVKYPRNPNI